MTQVLTDASLTATIRDMKKLGQDKQISYRSTPEIVAHLDLAAAKLATVEQFDGAKLRTGHLVNAVAIWLGRLDLDELHRFAAPKIRALEAYLRDDESLVGGRTVVGRPVKGATADGRKKAGA